MIFLIIIATLLFFFLNKALIGYFMNKRKKKYFGVILHFDTAIKVDVDNNFDVMTLIDKSGNKKCIKLYKQINEKITFENLRGKLK